MNVEELKITSSIEYVTIVVKLDHLNENTEDEVVKFIKDRFEANNDDSNDIFVECMAVFRLTENDYQFDLKVETLYKEAIYYVRWD